MTRLLLVIALGMAVIRFGLMGPASTWVAPAADPAVRTSVSSLDTGGHATLSEDQGVSDEQPGEMPFDGLVELEGDYVTPAVAKYTIDKHGNLYEVHAPNTEVSRLGSPEA